MGKKTRQVEGQAQFVFDDICVYLPRAEVVPSNGLGVLAFLCFPSWSILTHKATVF